MESGDILGHENMGEVIELGSEVTNLKIGDRVVVIWRTFEAGEPAIEIRRGFMASGSSRTSSILSKPLSNAAPLTWT